MKGPAAGLSAILVIVGDGQHYLCSDWCMSIADFNPNRLGSVARGRKIEENQRMGCWLKIKLLGSIQRKFSNFRMFWKKAELFWLSLDNRRILNFLWFVTKPRSFSNDLCWRNSKNSYNARLHLVSFAFIKTCVKKKFDHGEGNSN